MLLIVLITVISLVIMSNIEDGLTMFLSVLATVLVGFFTAFISAGMFPYEKLREENSKLIYLDKIETSYQIRYLDKNNTIKEIEVSEENVSFSFDKVSDGQENITIIDRKIGHPAITLFVMSYEWEYIIQLSEPEYEKYIKSQKNLGRKELQKEG